MKVPASLRSDRDDYYASETPITIKSESPITIIGIRKIVGQLQADGGRSWRLMFQDEARFGRINNARRCWAPQDLRPQVPVQIVREYTYVFGAASPHDGVLHTLVLPEVNAEMMSLFLAEVAGHHPDQQIVMVLDGAGWHRARELVVPENIRLLPLPSYSPQLNPMEHLWEEIREKWFPNLVFDSLDAVEDRLVEALRSWQNNPESVASVCGFDWIINIPMNAT